MTEHVAIAVELREIEAELSQVTKLIAKHPEYPSLLVDHDSLLKRQVDLQKAFAKATSDNLIDVCNYKIIPEQGDRYPVLALSKILSDFQELVTTAFDAIKTGKPKTRARSSAETVQLSSFDFAYAAAGSLNVTMTIPNERLLLIESDIDTAIASVFALMKAPSPASISTLAEKVGVASIKKLFELADEHKRYALSADVIWRRDEEIRNRVIVQAPEFEELCAFISEKSDEESELLTLTGRLAGLDVDLGTFHMTFPEGEDISGRLANSLKASHGVQIPGNYTAKLIKKTVIYYSTRQDRISYELLELT
jgi:hypothetical protein